MKTTAIAFGNWIAENSYRPIRLPGQWVKDEAGANKSATGRIFSTEGLYSEFEKTNSNASKD
jgi:hypothetical protein